jgi:DNA-binding response OmpR family regulator
MRGRAANILLVEDNPGDVRLLREALREAGVEAAVQWARDAEEALACVPPDVHQGFAAAPDLILLDLNLPRTSGRQVLADLRSLKHLDAVPIVVWTSSQAESDVFASYALRADAYVSKPLTLEELVRTLRGVCRFWLREEAVQPRAD